ncbi:MAG: bifunctional metallophosphatase/5'-nucleotidase, partial [Firmicutes bacterium]|nr:bifunctional metallophosphatase/5'-nucleotidase [Bacillota bacterium]
DAGGEAVPVEDDKLYSVVADLYSCQMLGTVKDQSFGLLKIEPKDENGKLITDYEDHIIYDGDDKELKAWYALASYIDSFEDDKVPEYYGQTHGRKTEIDSKSPGALLKQPNKIAFIVAVVVIVLVLLIVAIAALIRRHRRKKRTR